MKLGDHTHVPKPLLDPRAIHRGIPTRTSAVSLHQLFHSFFRIPIVSLQMICRLFLGCLLPEHGDKNCMTVFVIHLFPIRYPLLGGPRSSFISVV